MNHYKALLGELLTVLSLAESNDKGRPLEKVWADVLKATKRIKSEALALHEVDPHV